MTERGVQGWDVDVCLSEHFTSSADEARVGVAGGRGLWQGWGSKGHWPLQSGLVQGSRTERREGVCRAPGDWFPQTVVSSLGTYLGLGLERGALGPLEGP